MVELYPKNNTKEDKELYKMMKKQGKLAEPFKSKSKGKSKSKSKGKKSKEKDPEVDVKI